MKMATLLNCAEVGVRVYYRKYLRFLKMLFKNKRIAEILHMFIEIFCP